MITISAKVPARKDEAGSIIPEIGPFTINVDCPDDLEGLRAEYGDAAVYTNAVANWKVTIQSTMRSGMRRGESQEAMQARLGTARMGVSNQGVKVDPEQAFLAAFENANPEKQAELLRMLKEKVGIKK